VKEYGYEIGTWNVRSMHMTGSLRAVVEEISKYKLDLVKYRRSDGKKVALNQQANIHFSMERGMRIMN
jgi:hypothetical protein